MNAAERNPAVARTLPADAIPRPLDAYRATTPAGLPMSYPGFGWEGSCVDRAVSTDSPDAMKFCHEYGFIDHTTKTFFNTPLRRLCEERAPKCAKVLAALDYPS